MKKFVDNLQKILLTVVCTIIVHVSLARADNPPAYLLQWGRYGSGNGYFSDPRGVAVDASGNVYVTDNGNNRVQKFSGSGAYLSQWGTLGTGSGQFDNPLGIAVDAYDNIYVADGNNNRIQKFSTSGGFITQWGTHGTGNGQFNVPGGIAVDASGNVYVADTYNFRVEKFNSSGSYITQWGSQGTGNGEFSSPIAIGIDSYGDAYVVDLGYYLDNYVVRVEKFNSSGNYVMQWSPAAIARGLCVDATGNVFVSSAGGDFVVSDCVVKFTGTGEELVTWGSYGSGNSRFIHPVGVAVEASGDIYVVDSGNHRIQKFGPSTNCQLPSAPTGLTVENLGNGSALKIRWDSVPGATGYGLQRSDGFSRSQTDTEYTNVSLTPGTMYTYTVFAVNSCGTGSLSSPVSQTPTYYPVLFVHGVCDDGSIWDTFKQEFITQGFPVRTLTLDPNNGDPGLLSQELYVALRDWGKTNVTIIAHSLGGLVTREYIGRIVDGSFSQTQGKINRVKTVITLGTPHHGSDLAGWLDSHKSLEKLLTRKYLDLGVCPSDGGAYWALIPGSHFLNGLNYGNNTVSWDTPANKGGRGWDSHQPEDLRDPSVLYYGFGGTFPMCQTLSFDNALTNPLSASLARIWKNAQGYYPNDGAVSTASDHLYSTADSGQVHNWTDQDLSENPWTHSDNSDPLFCATAYYQSTQLEQTIINILKGIIPPGGTTQQDMPRLSAQQVQSNNVDSLIDLPALEGTLAAGQTIERAFTIPSTSMMQALVVGSDLHLQLRKPDGTLLSAADTATVSGLRFITDNSGGLEGFILSGSASGIWSLRIDGSGSVQDQNYLGVVEFNSTRLAGLTTSPSYVYPGTPVVVRAHIDSASVTLHNVTWTCSIIKPDSTTSSLTLYDDGAHSDSLPNDGIFGNAFTPTGSIGFYDLTANATLSDGVTVVTGTNVELAPANDLAVLSSQISLSRNVVAAGDSVRILAVVHNYSPGAVTGALVEVWDDKTGVRLDSLVVNIPSSGAVSISSPWKVAAPDTHYVRVTISPFTLSSEISYTNNSGLKQVVLGQPVNAVGPKANSTWLQLAPPMPNPSTNQTTLRFSLPQESKASLVIYDVLGRRIKEWTWSKLTAGPHSVEWDGLTENGQKVTPGVLFYRLDIGNQHLKQKLIHLQ